MPVSSEGSEGCDGSCHNTDEDVSDGHVTDVHVGPRLQARASESDQGCLLTLLDDIIENVPDDGEDDHEVTSNAYHDDQGIENDKDILKEFKS